LLPFSCPNEVVDADVDAKGFKRKMVSTTLIEKEFKNYILIIN
jgi:hypothetical protein